MTSSRTRAARLKLVAVLTTLLILVGAGGAAAYWTASTDLDGEASSATIGVTQTDPLKLKTVYDSGHLAAADIVTVHNTGTAPADISVGVKLEGGSTLPSALKVEIAKELGSGECSPSGSLEEALTGGHELTYLGHLKAGESIELCVRTSIPARAVFSHAGQQANVAVTSTLSYAEGADWVVSSSGETGAPLVQSVAQDPAAGVPEATCSSRWLSLAPRLKFAFRDDEVGPTSGYRAYLVHDGTTKDVPGGKADVQTSGKNVTVEIPDSELVKIGTELGIWEGQNVRIVIEKRESSTGEWRTVSVGKLRIVVLLIFSDNATCGWQ